MASRRSWVRIPSAPPIFFLPSDFAIDVHDDVDISLAHEFLLHFHRAPVSSRSLESLANRVPSIRPIAHDACGNEMRIGLEFNRCLRGLCTGLPPPAEWHTD
jgi:hypothetical protein